jgi:hypothetical protein
VDGRRAAHEWLEILLQKLRKYRLEILDFAASANALGKIWR